MEFVLVNPDVSQLSSFSGNYFGKCLITSWPAHGDKRGKQLTIGIRQMVSMSPCFVYKSDTAKWNANKRCVDINKNEIVYALKKKDLITQRDHEFNRREKLLQHNKKSDFDHLFDIQLLIKYFGFDQMTNVRSVKDLADACNCLRLTPWECMFRTKLKTYGKLKPLSLDSFRAACRDFAVVVPKHIDCAIKMYYTYLSSEYEEEGKTMFYWQTHAPHVMGLLERKQLEPEVLDFLEHRAITFYDLEKTVFSFKQDYEDAKTICQSLQYYHQNATQMAPELRDIEQDGVPAIPPQLTTRQTEIAQHILTHVVTIVDGIPGCGKTAMITWIMARFKRVLLCTLTGMMTKSLQIRNGNRKEAASTIDLILTRLKLDYANGKTWIDKFDVLVIDEFSNTDTHKLARLLRYCDRLVRVIFVGDHHQIRSIRPGDCFQDLMTVYGSQRLTEILRVAPDLVDLATAPKLISESRFNRVTFTPNGSLTLIQKAQSCRETLFPILAWILKQSSKLLDHQFVVLQHTERVSVNIACQDILTEMGVLKPKKSEMHHRIGAHEYFVGCKITFLKNMNKPFEHKSGQFVFRCETVANGELAIITDIKQIDKGFVLTVCDDCDITKSVICSNIIEGAINYANIDYGYATTTTKIQGREFPYCVFWCNTNPKSQWTRAHCYVALSRGKKRSWFVGSRQDFETICANKDKYRRTILCEILKNFAPQLNDDKTLYAKMENICEPYYTLLDPLEPCVPRYEKKSNEEDEDDEDEN